MKNYDMLPLSFQHSSVAQANQRLLRCWLVMIPMLLMVSFTSLALNTNAARVGDGWQILGDSKKSIQVSYKIENCNGVYKILLAAKNNATKAEVADFYLQVTKSEGSNEGFTKIVSFSAPATSELQGACSPSLENAALALALPAGYAPENVHVKIIFRFE